MNINHIVISPLLCMFYGGLWCLIVLKAFFFAVGRHVTSRRGKVSFSRNLRRVCMIALGIRLPLTYFAAHESMSYCGRQNTMRLFCIFKFEKLCMAHKRRFCLFLHCCFVLRLLKWSIYVFNLLRKMHMKYS